MICEAIHQINEFYLPWDCLPQSDSYSSLENIPSNIETEKAVPRIRRKQIRQRRKAILFGEKDRSSAIYKYIKDKQKSYLSDTKTSNTTFSPEEDRILVLLVQKLGPKFQKITKYFPGKTMNMLKNRYYKSLKDTEAVIIPKEKADQLSVKDKQKRVMGRKIINMWPEEQRMAALIDNSMLFPEAKELMQNFFSQFSCFVDNCMKGI